MSDAVDIVGPSQGVGQSRATSPARASTNASTAVSGEKVENMRVINDPRAGFITEYLNNDGSQVVSQVPSAMVVAYLRQGLTADGTVKATEAFEKTV